MTRFLVNTYINDAETKGERLPRQGMMQQSHSIPPQSQGMHGFEGPLTPFAMLEVDEVDDGGMASNVEY
jgi:hypothetical protein